MAENVVIDINASTKQFEGALDDLTAKVRSTAAQMDKALSFSGNASKNIKNTSDAVQHLNLGLRDMNMIAAGNILADVFEKAVGKVRKVGNEIYATTARMQSLEMGMKSLVTSDLVKTGQVKDYTEATKQAEGETKKLMDWFKELSLKSPYELTEVMESFKSNANMGQSVATAKKTTEAILALGAGLGMGQAEMKRFSAALAQTGATGRITAMDLRQFANNGFGMDKMNAIFDEISKKYNIVIKDNNDFNHAVAEGKITTDAFFDALNKYALDNYGSAVDAMASTIEGLKSSLGDIKTSAINDLFLETSKTISKTVAPYVEYLMQLLTGGDFSKWGEGINNWAKGILEPFQKIGETLKNGMMSSAITMLKDFLSGKSMNLGGVKVLLKELGGAEFADTWISRLQVIKSYIDKFMAHKDTIISAIKGIGIALATAFAVNKLTAFIGLLGKLNNPITHLTLLGAAFGVAWSKNLFDIQGKTEAVINYIKGLIDIYKTGDIKAVFEKVKNDILTVFDGIKDSIKQKITNLFEEIKSQGLGNFLKNIFTDALNKLQVPDNVKTTLAEIYGWIDKILQGIGGLALGIGSLKLIGFVSDLGSTLATVAADVLSVFTSIGATIASLGGLPVVIVAALTAVGFAIVGQFVNFGELIKNVLSTIKDTAVQTFSDIKTKVAERFAGLSETLSPFIDLLKAVGIVAAGVGTVLATAVMGIGTLIAGAVNGVISGLDEAIGAIISAIDFALSIIRLPFDLVVNLLAFIIGVVTGNGEMIVTAVNNVVGRIKHIWASFKAFWIDIWGFIKSFFSSVWDMIVHVIDSVDISAGLERLFGKEVAQKFEEIRDKVIGYIDEIKNAWQHMIGLLNGDIVIMDNGQEVSGKTYSAFQNKYDEELTAVNLANTMTAADWFNTMNPDFDITGVAKHSMEEYYAFREKSEESLFEEFTNAFLSDVEDYFGGLDERTSVSSKRSKIDAYVASKYDYVAEDPYLQSLLDGLYERLGLNTEAVKENTTTTEENTGKVADSSKNPKSTVDTYEREADAFDKYTQEQQELAQQQADALAKDIENADKIEAVAEDYQANLDKVVNDTTNGKGGGLASTLQDWWNGFKESLGFGKDFTIELPPVEFDKNATAEYEKNVTELRDFIQNDMGKILEDTKSEVESGNASNQLLDYSMKEIQIYLKNREELTQKGIFTDVLSSALSRSGLPNDIQEKFMMALDTQGVDENFLTTYFGILVGAVENAGLMASEGGSPTAGTEKTRYDWDMFNQYLAKEWNDYYAQYKTAIQTQMLENGMSAKDLAEGVNAKEGSKEYEAYKAAELQAITDLTTAVEGSTPKISAFNTSEYSGLEKLMGERLNELRIDMGETIDSFSKVTSENFADATSFLTDSSLWQTFADNVAWGDMDPDAIFNELFTNLNKLSSNPDWVSTFKADTKAALEDMNNADQLEFLMRLVAGVDHTIDCLNSDNTKALAAVESAVKGTKSSSGNGLVDSFDDLIASYQKASGTTKDLLGYELQAMLDATKKGSDWSANQKDRYLLTDLLNGEVNNETYKAVTTAMAKGEYSSAMFDFSWNNMKDRYLEDMRERKKTESYYGSLVDGVDTENLPDKEKLANKDTGLLGLLLGQDFDISEFGSQLFAGLAGGLDEETVSNLSNLANIDIDAEKAKGWIDFAAALNTLGVALQAMSTAFGVGENLESDGLWFTSFVDSMTNLLAIEMDETKLAGWLSFGDAMTTVGTALQGIAMAFGLVGEDAMEGMNAEVGVSMGASMEGTDTMAGMEGGLIGMMSALAGMEFNLDGWKGFVDALIPVQNALTIINGLLGTGMEEGGEEGGTGMLGALQNLMTMMTETFPPAIETFSETLTGTLPEAVNTALQSLGMFRIGEDGELGAAQGNTLYTSMGAIKGLIEDSNGAFYDFIRYLRNEIPGSVETFKIASQKIQDEFADIFAQANAAAGAAWSLVEALQQLEEMGGGGGFTFTAGLSGKGGGKSGGGKTIGASYVAGGTSGFRYGTAIVGEHGPELLTNNGSRAWTVFSNNTLMDEIAHTRHALNSLSSSAEMVAYNRLMGGGTSTTTTDNSQNFTNNIGTVVGDNAFRDMVDDYLTRAMRREMFLAR